MSKRGNRVLNEGGIKFKLREIISNERKLKIEQHPHAKEHFRFKRSGCMGQAWRWFVRINPYCNSPSSYVKRNRIDYMYSKNEKKL